MAKRDMLMGILEDMGYKPQIDQDGDLLIRHEMKSIYVIVGDEDDLRVVLLLPQFVEVEEDEIVLVLTACNNVTREIKMAKVFLERSLKAVSGEAAASSRSFITKARGASGVPARMAGHTASQRPHSVQASA